MALTYPRILQSYLDWCSFCMERTALEERDWVPLIAQRSFHCIRLLEAYTAVEYGIAGVPLGKGFYYPFAAEEQSRMDPT